MTLMSETANITPAQAAARRAQSKAAVVEMLFDVPPPYSIGIGKEIKRVRPDLPAKHIGFALRHITNKKRYLKAAVSADHRTGLDGKESPLLEKHKQHALDMLKKRPNSPSKRLEDEKQAIPPPETPTVRSDETVEPAGVIQPTRRRVLSLKKATS